MQMQNVASALENGLSSAELTAPVTAGNPLELALQPTLALHRALQRCGSQYDRPDTCHVFALHASPP